MGIVVNLIGVLLIVFIIWWFWLYKKQSEATIQGSSIDIIVDSGIYEPSVIHAKQGQEITLRFIRKDSNPCSEKVLFNDLDISADLPIGKPHNLTFTPDEKGEFEFTCQMAMYRGKLIVE
ncbi:MAG: copper-binding protein [Thermodesulfobacteriota bacterium]|nr:MAG: copper-binding protein [Thermodesulfobacteriota bacterium]